MQDINPQGFSNPVLSAATSGDVEAARQNMINAFADAAQLFADRGVHKDVAVLFQADPLSAEIGLRDNLFHLGRSTLSGAIESFDFGPSVEVEGKKYTKAEPTTGHAIGSDSHMAHFFLSETFVPYRGLVPGLRP